MGRNSDAWINDVTSAIDNAPDSRKLPAQEYLDALLQIREHITDLIDEAHDTAVDAEPAPLDFDPTPDTFDEPADEPAHPSLMAFDALPEHDDEPADDR